MKLCGFIMHVGRRILRRLERWCEGRDGIEHTSTQTTHAFQVFLGACRARNRALRENDTRAAKGETGILTSDSIVAILLAGAATEAFINEFAELIGLLRQNAGDSVPFQAFAQLIDLRGAIMHIKPPRPHARHSGQQITDTLAQRGIAINRSAWSGSWYDRLQTPAVAAWACATAQSIIAAVLEMVPHSEIDFTLGPVYRHFQSITKVFDRTDWGTDSSG